MAVVAATEASNGCTLEVAVGDSIELELPENRTTGYRWHVLAAGEPVCEKTGEQFVPGPRKPGAPGLLHCEFQVKAGGVARIQLASRRSWSSADERSFTLDISARA